MFVKVINEETHNVVKTANSPNQEKHEQERGAKPCRLVPSPAGAGVEGEGGHWRGGHQGQNGLGTAASRSVLWLQVAHLKWWNLVKFVP